jgi:hypothetical protein
MAAPIAERLRALQNGWDDPNDVVTLGKDAADQILELLAALIAIAQRANESGNDELGERETIYAMHGLARAAIARAARFVVMSGAAEPELIRITRGQPEPLPGHRNWLWEVDYADPVHNAGGHALTLADAIRAVSETVQNVRGAG